MRTQYRTRTAILAVLMVTLVAIVVVLGVLQPAPTSAQSAPEYQSLLANASDYTIEIQATPPAFASSETAVQPAITEIPLPAGTAPAGAFS